MDRLEADTWVVLHRARGGQKNQRGLRAYDFSCKVYQSFSDAGFLQFLLYGQIR